MGPGFGAVEIKQEIINTEMFQYPYPKKKSAPLAGISQYHNCSRPCPLQGKFPICSRCSMPFTG